MSLDQPIADIPTALDSPNGEAAAVREARRMDRLAELEQLRRRAGRISARLCDLIEGNLPPDQDDPLSRLADPVLAFTRVATAIRRIVALEEQIDEDAETRAERLAEEAAKKAAARAAAETARAADSFHKTIRVNRHVTRKFLRDDIRARDGDMTRVHREMLLNDLTADLDDLDYVGDPDALIAQLAKELDDIVGPPPVNGGAAPRPKPPRGWKPVSAQDVSALLVQNVDTVRRRLSRMADG